VTVLELPPGEAALAAERSREWLAEFVTGFARGAGGTVISQKEIKAGAHPGREFRVSLANGAAIAYAQTYLVNGKVISVILVARAEMDVSAARADFFGSLKLK
jgi:hypothetical protein